MIKVSLISLGCAKNLVDSEIMIGHLHQAGMVVIPEAEKADVVIVNTCSFIDSSKEESIGHILEVHQNRGMKKRRKEQKLIVAGCMSQRFSKDLSSSLNDEVDAYKVSDSLSPQAASLGQKPPMEAFLTHVIEQFKASPAILECQTLLILSDSHKLEDIKHWRHTARWIVDRTAYQGPDSDKWFAMFVPSDLFPCHFVWTAVYILKALLPFLPETDLVLLDHDAAFTT